jgi:hypothetical protein
MKIRASYGLTGNDDIPALAYENLLFQANYPLGGGSGSVNQGAYPSSILGNREIGWEQTREFNGGVDLSFNGGKVGLTVDFYHSITNNLLFLQTSMATTGRYQQWSNVGSVSNTGFEMEINTVNISNRKFRWRTSFNVATNQNKLLDLGGEPFLLNYGDRNEIYAAIIGHPAIQYFGYVTDGVWGSWEEINAAIASGNHNSNLTGYFTPGGLKLKDMNGDGIIDENDRVPLGNPFPKFTWGLTNNFNIGAFDISFLFQGVHGVRVINDNPSQLENMRTNKFWNNGNRVFAPGTGDGKTPYGHDGFSLMLTDYVVDDASFVTMRNLMIGYTLPNEIARKLKLRRLRVYAAAENSLFFAMNGGKWGSRNINPEARHQGEAYRQNPLMDGLSRGVFPVQQSFNFGIEVQF